MNGCGHVPGASWSLYNWHEVTPGFLAACSTLKLGELCHDDTFGLFEAMSAIEMMDPKMDAGMVCNRANATPMTWDSAVEKKEIVLDGISGDLSPEDAVLMIDQTLACFVTWLEGHSLAQTVLTNLYLHHVDKIQCGVLKSVSVVALKLVELVKDIIGKASVFEEEDFQPLTYGFKLCQDVSEHRCVAGLKEAEEVLAREIRRTKVREGIERSSLDEKDNIDYTSLHARVKFLRLFFCGLNSLYRGDSGEGSRLIGNCLEILNIIRAGYADETQEEKRVKGFEPLANQRLLPPTFPRYTEIVKRSEAVKYLEQLVSRLSTVTAVTNIPSFHNMLDFFQSFSATSPCVLSRSVLQLLYTPLHSPPTRQLMGSPPAGPPLPPGFPELLRDSCKSFMAPPCLLPAPRVVPGAPQSPLHSQQVRMCLDTFFSQCCRPFGLLLQATGHNRARQRDKISQVLEEFSSVQEEADRLDNMLNTLSLSGEGASGKPHSLFLGTWLLYHVLKLMVRYTLSGFELELYSVHEWAMVFWYLYELLYPWLINCLHRADTVLSEHIENIDREKREKGGKGKKRTKAMTKKGVKSRPYLSEIARYQAHASMCAGYYKLMVAAKQEKKIMIPNPQFDNEIVRYEHRFGAFANLLTPPLMPYTQFKEVLEHTEKASIKTLYTAASSHFGQARQILETVQASLPDEEISSLITINKTNFVVASVLTRDCNREIDFEFSLHQNFPIVKLV